MRDRKIRVLHALGWVASGGVEQMRLLLARGLPQGRYEHLVICQESFGYVAEQLRGAGWTIHEIGLASHILSPTWHNRAARIARAFQPDIIHGAVIEGVALANSIGLRFPKARVISEETSDPVNRSWRADMLMRAMCLRSDTVIGVSPVVLTYLRERAKIPKRKLLLINNAVGEHPAPSEARLASLRTALGLGSHNIVIGSVGRVLDSHKRFSDIIKAMPRLAAGHPEVRLLIVGDGPDRAMLQKLAGTLGVSNMVVFAGYQGDARDFYSLMNVSALASAHEAFGLVLVEAMLAGVPTVGTAVGGIPFVLNEGKAGILVPPFQPAALASAISRLLSGDALRMRFAEAGLERARMEFSAERYCQQINALYSNNLSGHRAAP